MMKSPVCVHRPGFGLPILLLKEQTWNRLHSIVHGCCKFKLFACSTSRDAVTGGTNATEGAAPSTTGRLRAAFLISGATAAPPSDNTLKMPRGFVLNSLVQFQI